MRTVRVVSILTTLLVCVIGCDRAPVVYHRNRLVNLKPPPLRMPVEFRQENWTRRRSGSCSHAGFANALVNAGLFGTAQNWRTHYGGGAVVDEIEKIAHRYGLGTAKTTTGDVQFLVVCHKAGIPAMIHYYPVHSVTFVRFSKDYRYVILQEVNWPREIKVSLKRFIPNWNYYGRRQGYDGGAAITLLPLVHPPLSRMPPCSSILSHQRR